MPEALVLGVDGGGSKTLAVLAAADGRVLGVGHSGGGNYQRNGVTGAVEAVWEAVEQALNTGGARPDDVAFTVYALAGADRPSDEALLRPALCRLLLTRTALVCDTFAGLRLGSPQLTGVVLICGSGTNAVGRDASSRTWQVGGFGWPYGDAAGGHILAAFALRAAVRSWEGREVPSLLVDEVPPLFGCADMAELMAEVTGVEPWQASPGAQDAIPRIVHKAAEAGDELSIRLLTDMGTELGRTARALLGQMTRDTGEDSPKCSTQTASAQIVDDRQSVPVVLVGSVIQNGRSPFLLRALEAELNQSSVSTRLVIPELHPVFGAVQLAMDRANVSVTPATLARFAEADLALPRPRRRDEGVSNEPTDEKGS